LLNERELPVSIYSLKVITATTAKDILVVLASPPSLSCAEGCDVEFDIEDGTVMEDKCAVTGLTGSINSCEDFGVSVLEVCRSVCLR
jgi:hypothetical protein